MSTQHGASTRNAHADAPDLCRTADSTAVRVRFGPEAARRAAATHVDPTPQTESNFLNYQHRTMSSCSLAGSCALIRSVVVVRP